MRSRWSKTLTAGCALLAMVAVPTMASAQDAPTETRRSAVDDDGPQVRRKLLYRSTRLELSPSFGVTLGDAYTQNVMVGANAAFHLTNDIGFQAAFHLGVVHPGTSLRESLLGTVPNSRQQNISFSRIAWIGELEGTYVPLFGKFSIMDGVILNYDLHLLGGVAFINQAADPAIAGGAVDDGLVSVGPGAVLGGGIRLFMTDGISLNIDVRNYLVSRAQVSSRPGDAEPEFTANPMVNLSLSFFLPGDVKVSR